MSFYSKKYITLFLGVTSYFLATAQFNQTEVFTIKDGLAMTECGAMYFDRSGKLWINHANGWLSVYDGLKFTRYNPQEIGAYLDGTQFTEDHKGIWIRKEKTVSLFSKGKWKTFDAPEAWNILTDKKTNTFVLLDKSGRLWKLFPDGSHLVSFAKLPEKKAKEDYTIVNSRINDSCLLLIRESETPYRLIKAFVSESLINPKWEETPSLVTPGLDWAFHNYSKEQLLHLDAKSLKNYFIKDDANLNVAGNDLIYSCTYPNVLGYDFLVEVYKINKDDSIQFLARFITGHKDVSVTIDNAGNIWSASHVGLTKIIPSVLQCSEDNPGMVPALHTINEDEQGRIWFGGYSAGLCYFREGKLSPCPADAKSYKRFLPGSYRDGQGKMAFWTEEFDMVTYDQGEWNDARYLHPEAERIRGYYFLPIHGDLIAAGLQNKGLGITKSPLSVNSTWKLIGREKGMLLDNVLTIAEDPKHRLWMGRMSQGIAVYDPDMDTAQTWLIIQDSEFNYGSISSVVDASGRLWLGCNDGLRVLEDPADFTLFKDDLHDNLQKINLGEAGNSQVNILTTYHQYLIFGNSLGYGFIDLNTYHHYRDTPRIYFFPTGKFGMSCEQNAVLIDQDEHLWIGHDRGAMRIDLNGSFLDSAGTDLIAREIITHGKNGDTTILYFDSTNTVKLPANKRNITVRILPDLHGWLNDNVSIQYGLLTRKNEDTLWSNATKDFDIRLEILPPGKNLLLVRAIKNNQTVDEATFLIRVPAKLIETFWFWFSLFCITSWIGFIITRSIYRQRLQLRLTQINLAEQQREKNQFQISAIANSLNPHFIKNTLMWMQSRFRKDEEVVDVIDRLAYNIGNVFAHSRNGNAFHTLEEEVKVTENFLAIQIATYGSFINFSFPDKDQWLPYKHIKVPLLLLQIHVENAIEHGLRPKSGREKNLKLEIAEEDEYLNVLIEDDGIGRKAARERGSHGTKQGTIMLDRVFELYNQKNKLQFTTTYIDLYDSITGVSKGTKVVIRIPKQYKTDLT